jgi:hypothetical protein
MSDGSLNPGVVEANPLDDEWVMNFLPLFDNENHFHYQRFTPFCQEKSPGKLSARGWVLIQVP